MEEFRQLADLRGGLGEKDEEGVVSLRGVDTTIHIMTL